MNNQELNSKAFKRAESNLLNKLSAAFLRNYPHHVMPGYNLNKSPCVNEWNEENAMGLYQNFPYYCDLPKPLLPPAKLSRTVLSEEDPALQLLTFKSHLKDDINRLMNYYEKHKQELGTISKKNKWNWTGSRFNTKIPRYIADLAELFDKDPDPYFEGTYNWYYTGGSLNHVQLHGSDILLFQSMEDLVAANIVLMEDAVWKPLLQNSAKCKLSELVYEIRQNQSDNTCRILGRHKNHCTLYMLYNSENQLILREIYKQASKVPYISADLSSVNINQHCTLNAEKIVSLWDITKLNCISNGSVSQNATRDVWGSIRFQQMDPNVLIYTDRCCLHYIDTRCPFDRPDLTLCPKFYLENCESLSVNVASKHNSCQYLGTSHYLLLCDNRFAKHCVQQKWTHQLTSTPLLATVTVSNDKEFLVLSTQTAGENSIILNTWVSEEESHSFNLPFTPPCIIETLNESRMQGMCLDPYLRNRLEMSNVGSILITGTKEGKVYYFVQNSIGDIFYQCITHESVLDKYSCINSKACYALNLWEKALSAYPEPIIPLTLSDKCNMHHIYNNLTNKKLRLKYKEDDASNLFELTWKQSLATLGSYIDILAPELLTVWEVSEEVAIPVSTAPHQKVLNWLESAISYPTTQSQDEVNDIPTPVNTQELISVSQEQDITQINDSDVLQEILLPKVRLIPNKKKKC